MSDTNGRAVASFVLGLLGLLGILPCIGSVPAIVFGKDQPDGLARAGVVMGWIGLALLALTILIIGGVLVFGIGIAAVQGN